MLPKRPVKSLAERVVAKGAEKRSLSKATKPPADESSPAPDKEEAVSLSITVKKAHNGYTVECYKAGEMGMGGPKPHIAKDLNEADVVIDKYLEDTFGEKVDEEPEAPTEPAEPEEPPEEE